MKAFRITQPLLLAGMMLCWVTPIVLLGERWLVGWKGDYLLFLVPFVVLEGIWSRRIYQREKITGMDQLWRWVAEAVVLILIAKLCSYSGRGMEQFLVDLAMWVEEPIRIITVEILLVSVIILIVWMLGQSMQSELERLSDPGESGSERQMARERLMGFTFGGGFWLLMVSGIVFALSKGFDLFQEDLFRSLQIIVVGYAILCLVFLAHIQYLRRKMEWSLEGMPIPEKIGKRWLSWGAGMALGVFLVAIILPAIYLVGPDRLLFWLFGLFGYLAKAVVFVLLLVCSPIFWLLSQLMGEQSVPPESLPDLTFPPALPTGEPPAWWISLRQIILFIVIAMMLVAILVTYMKDRRISLPMLTVISERLKWILRKLHQWLLRFRGRAKWILKGIKLRRASPQDSATRVPGRISLYPTRSPRGRIRRYYLTFLERARETGHTRAPQQTPREYADQLVVHVTDQQAELSTLTEAFIQARYSSREMDPEEVRPVHEAWKKLRGNLRRWKSR